LIFQTKAKACCQVPLSKSLFCHVQSKVSSVNLKLFPVKNCPITFLARPSAHTFAHVWNRVKKGVVCHIARLESELRWGRTVLKKSRFDLFITSLLRNNKKNTLKNTWKQPSEMYTLDNKLTWTCIIQMAILKIE
jgi:hypothetical protein